MPATLAPSLATSLAPQVPVAIGRLVLLGHPVSHSLSPRFQNAALRAARIPLLYQAVDVAPDALPGMLDALVEARAAGNVTLPHKEAVAARCELRTPLAARVGAVNTFWCTLDGRLWGDNTDVAGVDASVRALFQGAVPSGLQVALLGAGGSAAAVLAAAESWPAARVRVWSRTRARAELLAARFPSDADVPGDRELAVRGADLVVNATPLGLRHDDAFPAPLECLAPSADVFDLVYRPGETAWVRAARARGHRAADGLPILIAQGAASFARWFGVAPDAEVLWAAVGGRPHAGR
ncbi:MAG: shikimate dehydrogenase family protein [Gemmatirosa sp.]